MPYKSTKNGKSIYLLKQSTKRVRSGSKRKAYALRVGLEEYKSKMGLDGKKFLNIVGAKKPPGEVG